MSEDGRSEPERHVFSAIFENNTELLQELLEAGVRVNASDRQGLTPLHEAASLAHPHCLAILLRYDVELDGKSYTGQTALHRAASSNSRSKDANISPCVSLLVDSGASLTARDGAGLTPVEAAAQANNNDVVMYLKSAMDDMRKKEEKRKHHELLQEMFEACNSGDKRKLDKLVSSHPDLVNGTLHDDGSTLLHRCSRRDDVEMLRSLISFGATLCFDRDKKTPLDYAAEKGATSLVAELLHCRSKTVDGNLALLSAAERGHCGVVEALIISQVVAYKELADQVKQGLEPDEDLADLFTAVRVDINCEDVDGHTALYRASQGNFVDVVKALLTCAPRNIRHRHGIDPGTDTAVVFTTSHSSFGKPALNSGSYNESTTDFENDALISFKKNIILNLEVRSQKGHTAFHEACRRRNFDIIRLLAYSDADINAMEHPRQLDNPREYNALVDAIIKGQCDLVIELLTLGVKDTSNHVAFNTAVQFGKDDMVGAMLAHTNVVEIANDDAKPLRKKSQHIPPDKCESKFSAHWNGIALYIKGDWDLKFAWLSRAPQYLSVGTTAVISKLHLRENQLTKVPLELFHMEGLEVLDLSKNNLTALPLDVIVDEHNNSPIERSSERASHWTCHKLKEIDVSENHLKTLPVQVFHLKALVQVCAANNVIDSLPVDMWLSETIKEMNFAHNLLDDLPHPEPCLMQQSRSMSIRDPSTRRRSMIQMKRPRLLTIEAQQCHMSYSLTPYAAMLRSTVSSSPSGARSVDEDEDEDEHDASIVGSSMGQRTFKSSLKVLNVSHNNLVFIPVGLPCLAQELERLNLSHNQIKSLGCPSNYPQSLTTLDASGNGAVQTIHAEHEDTDDTKSNDTTSNDPAVCYGFIQDSMLGGLSLASHSVIHCRHRLHENLPNLDCLKLSDNYLTRVYVFSGNQSHYDTSEQGWIDIEMSGRVSSLNEASKPLFPNLALLDVRCNQLKTVPYRVWDLPKLVELLLSHNKDIKELPTAMGRLVNLFRLDLEGVSNELSIPSHIDCKRAPEIIRHLRSIHERACDYRRIKLMLVGCHRQGKTTLLRVLTQGSKATTAPTHFNQRRERVHTGDNGDLKYDQISTVGVDLGKWTYTKPEPFIFFGRRTQRPAIEFLTWDFAGQDEYYATHQCFLSKRALYLVVWNVEKDREGIEEMEKWLMNIQARAPNAAVILVGTHIDKVTDTFLQRIDDNVKARYLIGKHASLQKDKGLPRILSVVFVSCTQLKYIENLRQLLYTTASELTEVIGSYSVRVLDQQVPSSYIQLEKQILDLAKRARESGTIPVLEDTEFREKASIIVSDPDDLNQGVNFLHQNGVLLHYNDPQLRRLYFIDPQWLCDMLAHVVTVDHVNRYIKNGIMKQDDLVHIFRGKVFELRNEYVQLLIKFEVALPIGLQQEYLLIPSKLPNSIHKAQSLQPRRCNDSHDAKVEILTIGKSVVCRFYYMIYVPSGFWPRLISRVLTSRQFDQIVSSIAVSFSDDVIENNVPSAFSPSWFYWKTGIELRVNGSPILSVKEVSACQEGIIGSMARAMHGSLSLCTYGTTDILETRNYRCIEIVAANLFTRESLSQSNELNKIPSLKSAELLANAVETIDLLIDDWYPGIANDGGTGQGNPFLTKIVPCPDCLESLVRAEREAFGTESCHESDGQFEQVPLEAAARHSKSYYCHVAFVFQLVECALKAQSEGTIHCPHHEDIDLSRMTPDLLFHDLKLNLIVDSKQLVEEEVVGVGAFADVCKGKYYPEATEGDLSPDAGIAVAIKKLQQRQRDAHCKQPRLIERELSVDTLETEAYKAYKAYLETRREVAILANVNHEHIVRFFGVQLDPRSLILEWAPMGSLETVLRTYEDRSIAPRPLQQLIVQISDGVRYLHSKSIVYRDLKSSNVLVWKFPEPLMQLGSSTHADSTVNHGVWVKLADFGVSRLAAPGGLVRGEGGTPGFMAPEIVLFRGDEAYTEKIFIPLPCSCMRFYAKSIHLRATKQWRLTNSFKKRNIPTYRRRSSNIHSVPYISCSAAGRLNPRIVRQHLTFYRSQRAKTLSDCLIVCNCGLRCISQLVASYRATSWLKKQFL
ncbi:leucine-rich repeat serine/threonine-protein kinase 1-like isoform X2 [Corticium candelabrum]|uniref:leucine-rich repeat serine/threonine-protein kinase 1-like isoform X2 n=1 Tax=Corticium candelabrum TaxID=121492 RepID=UPI002E2714B3|nr:leucine-rich repeat serine/threonine-protein kinase 1-like isoform X2 [Corticium candelabrum]